MDTNDHVVSGLLAKHDELASRLKALRQEQAQILKALEHVGATIRLYRPTIRLSPLSPVRLRRPQPQPPGTYVGEALAVLRLADSPLTTREIAERALKARGVENPDPRQIGRLTPTIGMALNTRERKGLVVVTGNPKRWEIVR